MKNRIMKRLGKKVRDLTSKSLVGVFKVCTVIQCLSYQTAVFATGGIQDSKLVTGTTKLIQDGTTGMLLLEAGLVIFLEIKTGIAYQAAEVEEKTKHKKEAKAILVVGALIVAATSIIKMILSYYQ